MTYYEEQEYSLYGPADHDYNRCGSPSGNPHLLWSFIFRDVYAVPADGDAPPAKIPVPRQMYISSPRQFSEVIGGFHSAKKYAVGAAGEA